ncbi:MAG: HD domain-containing protein [Muribaculaceae bacterium]|nr:HD domain-containing protein [Muribaculaceae bacterium]
MLDCLSIIQRYYTPGNDDYRVLVSHSRKVADLAIALSQRLIDRGTPIDIEFVEEAAMLHDIGMCRTDAPGIHCHGTEPYILHGILGRKMLDGMGLFRHGRVCERHTGAGITADEIVAQHLPIDPPRDLLPESLEEKVVCYADKFFSKSRIDEQPKSLERARKSLAKFGGDTLSRFDDLVALFGDPADLCSNVKEQ